MTRTFNFSCHLELFTFAGREAAKILIYRSFASLRLDQKTFIAHISLSEMWELTRFISTSEPITSTIRAPVWALPRHPVPSPGGPHWPLGDPCSCPVTHWGHRVTQTSQCHWSQHSGHFGGPVTIGGSLSCAGAVKWRHCFWCQVGPILG